MSATVVTLGELMMRLTPPRKLRLRQASGFDICHGGAEANVANSLAHFGIDARFISGQLEGHNIASAAALLVEAEHPALRIPVEG